MPQIPTVIYMFLKFCSKFIQILSSRLYKKNLSLFFRLPELSKYIEQWDAVDGEESTVSINQVNNLSALLEDVEIAWKALTLPILEPLTTDMLQKVTKIVKGKAQ